MKAVVFDFYGTLAEFNDRAMSWQQLVAEIGYELPPDTFNTYWGINDGIEHTEQSQSREHYVAWEDQRMRAMLDACGVPRTEHDAFVARARDGRRHRDLDAYAEVAEVLDALRGAGLALAVCSNWNWDLRESMESAGLSDAFDVVVSSAWVGARKSHPRIYAHTLRELDVPPDEVLFIGDTWTCDVAGPAQAGMQAVYVRRAHFGADATVPADADPGVQRATDLRAVLDLVP